MRIVERSVEWYESLTPDRQRAVQFFAAAGLGSGLAGISVIPVVEGFNTAGGVVGIVEGTVGGSWMYAKGWRALERARQEDETTRRAWRRYNRPTPEEIDTIVESTMSNLEQDED